MSIAPPTPQALARADIHLDALSEGSTALVLQRNAEYERRSDTSLVGTITAEAAQRVRSQAEAFFAQLLAPMRPEERFRCCFLVATSPAAGMGLRAAETAECVLAGLQAVIEHFDLARSQIANTRAPWRGAPIPSRKLEPSRIYTESPEFVRFVADKFSAGKIDRTFFIHYEADEGEIRAARLAAGAEGPLDVAERIAALVRTTKGFSDRLHAARPQHRLVVWAVTHYDGISPYVRTRLGGDPARFLPVEYEGGLVISFTLAGAVSTRIGGDVYEVSLDGR